MKPAAPDWRLPAQPVLRDMEPGKIAVPLYDVDGGLCTVSDFPAALVARMERAAKEAGQTFAAVYTALVADAVKRDGFRNG